MAIYLETEAATQSTTDEVSRAVIYLRVSTSRQAHKNGEAEGYSIPAQREACRRKAEELGATVIEEFVDAGASARSADRDGLQAMLAYLGEYGAEYVIVHKIDRLARDRMDDAFIHLKIKSAGAALVSVMENIDDTPSGKFQHAVMAGMAEYYSSNLSHEAKKGIAQKAKNGGTHGVAPIGYLNTLTRTEGREIKGVALDAERAPHITWAFRTYAEGQVSVSDLRDLLEERGLRSRKTKRYVGGPLSNAQVHRMLSNPYYAGRIRHRGVIYDGTHEAIVDDETWNEVQRVLSGRRIAGDRSWKHTHFLKGIVKCARCKGRMGFGYSSGRGGTYAYFFCLNRHTGRSDCDLPYLQQEEVEAAVDRLWRSQKYSEEELKLIEQSTHELVRRETEETSELVTQQKSRLVTLERQRQRLIDAYLDGIVQPDDLKIRQDKLLAEIADTKRLIQNAAIHGDIVKERIGILLTLARKAHKLYRSIGDKARGELNRAQFNATYVDAEDSEPGEVPQVALEPAHADVPAAFAAVAQEARLALNAPGSVRNGATRAGTAESHPAEPPEDNEKTPGKLSLTGGPTCIYWR
ncbi:MAG: recombinase family protein [Microbacterium hominis]|uniref:recombinase family protein n=1 Tax=Microbacterium aurum TaxID=36805 RepID=UPI00248E821D|nr:recombinase family protein [Microbacterium aurum]MBZ6371411.1 recombinase family protein [Microbacterium hominis]